jgi:hypothetical protein
MSSPVPKSQKATACKARGKKTPSAKTLLFADKVKKYSMMSDEDLHKLAKVSGNIYAITTIKIRQKKKAFESAKKPVDYSKFTRDQLFHLGDLGDKEAIAFLNNMLKEETRALNAKRDEDERRSIEWAVMNGPRYDP